MIIKSERYNPECNYMHLSLYNFKMSKNKDIVAWVFVISCTYSNYLKIHDLSIYDYQIIF